MPSYGVSEDSYSVLTCDKRKPFGQSKREKGGWWKSIFLDMSLGSSPPVLLCVNSRDSISLNAQPAAQCPAPRSLNTFLNTFHPQVCQKSGEISLLKQQLKESQAELVQKGSELVALRVALREARAALRVSEGRARGLQEAARARELELEACSQELQRYRQEAERLREKAGHLDAEASGLREPPGPPAATDPFLLAESDEAKVQRAAAGAGGSLRAQVERLRQELQREQQRGDEQRDSFEGERLAWQAEKEQVIRYQKQLQHNYIQMYRRNRQLEQELQQLSLELEARELADLGLAEPAPCICLEEITATEI